MKSKFTLLFLLGSLTTLTSCVDFSGLQEAAQNEVDQLQAQLESNDYKDGLSNNFQDGYDLRDDNDMYGFYGYGNEQRRMGIHKTPPMQHRAEGCNNGMSVDGGSIYRQNNGDFNFQNDPRYTMYNRGDDAMLGVMENGVPVYAKRAEDTGLDAQSGHFGPTADYPQGIYHYHVVINNYNY
jgi:hypothetical protein